MKSNKCIVDAFYEHKTAENTNMRSTGDKLYSYSTVIAQHINNKVIKNITKYSRSTGKQQSYISKFDYIAEKVPINTQSLIEYI